MSLINYFSLKIFVQHLEIILKGEKVAFLEIILLKSYQFFYCFKGKSKSKITQTLVTAN